MHSFKSGCQALAVWLGLAVVSCEAQIVFQDNFNGALNPAWTIVRPNSSYYTLQPNGLDLRCNSGDLYQTDNNALNVFVVSNPCPGDFKVTARLRWLTPPSTSYAQFALLAYDDDDNYVRGYYGDVPAGKGFYLATEVGASYAGAGSTNLDTSTNEFWIQLLKQDFYYTVLYSLDGTNFIAAQPGASFQDGVPTHVGFVAMVDPTQTAEALVESFTVESIPFPAPAPGLVYQPLSLAGVVNAQNTWLGNQPSGAVVLGGVPFNLLAASTSNIWNSAVNTAVGVQSASTMQLPVQLHGVAAVDALVNTGWGNPGSQWVAFTFQFSDGSSFTNVFTAGQDIRDWLQNIYVNDLTSTNCSQVFSTTDTSYAGKWGRIDKQHVVIPAQFAGLTLTNIVLTDTGVTGNNDATYSLSVHAQRAYLEGLTATVAATPPLSIAASPGVAQLSWPTNVGSSWFLQATTNLVPSRWARVATTPVVTGTNFTIPFTNAPGPATQFFRLAVGL